MEKEIHNIHQKLGRGKFLIFLIVAFLAFLTYLLIVVSNGVSTELNINTQPKAYQSDQVYTDDKLPIGQCAPITAQANCKAHQGVWEPGGDVHTCMKSGGIPIGGTCDSVCCVRGLPWGSNDSCAGLGPVRCETFNSCPFNYACKWKDGKCQSDPEEALRLKSQVCPQVVAVEEPTPTLTPRPVAGCGEECDPDNSFCEEPFKCLWDRGGVENKYICQVPGAPHSARFCDLFAARPCCDVNRRRGGESQCIFTSPAGGYNCIWDRARNQCRAPGSICPAVETSTPTPPQSNPYFNELNEDIKDIR